MGGYIDSLSDSGSGSDNEKPRPARAEYPFLLGPSPKGANAGTSRRPTRTPSSRTRRRKTKFLCIVDLNPSTITAAAGTASAAGPRSATRNAAGMRGRISLLIWGRLNMAKLRVHLLVGLRSSTTTVVHRAEAGVGVLRGLRVGPEVVRAEEMVRRRYKWRGSNH